MGEFFSFVIWAAVEWLLDLISSSVTGFFCGLVGGPDCD
jgi:hypothetical protein